MNSMYKGECYECGNETYFYKVNKGGPDPEVFCSKLCETNYKYKKQRGLDR